MNSEAMAKQLRQIKARLTRMRSKATFLHLKKGKATARIDAVKRVLCRLSSVYFNIKDGREE